MSRSGTSCRVSGFARVRVDGQSVSLDEPPKLSHRRKHKIEVVVDRAIVRRATRSRLADSIGAALDLGKGVVHIARVGDEASEPSWPVDRYSQHRVCDRLRPQFRRAGASPFFVQQPAGLVPGLPRAGRPARRESGRAHPRRPAQPAPRSRRRLAGSRRRPLCSPG